MQRDPVFQDDGGKWYFWDECWIDMHGPFDDEDTARDALARHGNVSRIDLKE